MSERPSEFLIVLIFLWFYDCVHYCGTIKVLWYCWCTVQTWRVLVWMVMWYIRSKCLLRDCVLTYALFYKKYRIHFLSLVFGIHEKFIIMGLSRNMMSAQIFTNLTHKLAFLYVMAYCNTRISFMWYLYNTASCHRSRTKISIYRPAILTGLSRFYFVPPVKFWEVKQYRYRPGVAQRVPGI
jgi:hypothetical protein